jgi:hypothetical protein
MVLDQATLFAVATSITGLLGIFLLLLWWQERGMRALAWWGGAYLMGACAVTLWAPKGLPRTPWCPPTWRTPSCFSPAG